MKVENLTVYYGESKTNAAFGKAVEMGGQGQSVYIIQFFKAKNIQYADFLERLEPEVKFFHFQRAEGDYSSLSDVEKEEELMNTKNAINFARKVMTTRECDLLILDEFLDVVHNRMIEKEELDEFFRAKPEEMELILTGKQLEEEIRKRASKVYHITTE
ncbi:MAG: cob(I)yrinic acid a,c-diamide adenosyltransferase [Eubacterium sp.]|nr:cob(I)yrinic acid a,c-diamide adenosyltransferase [Eubacterium sp.]